MSRQPQASDTAGLVLRVRPVAQAAVPAAQAVASGTALEAALRATRTMAWEANPADFRFSWVSDVAVEMFGYPLERWYEPGFWVSMLHPEDRDGAAMQCLSNTERGLDHEFEYRAVRADGATIWVQDIVTLERDAGGRVTCLRGLMLDITVRKQQENRVFGDGERLRLAASLAGIRTWDWNAVLDEIRVDGASLLPPADQPRSLDSFLALLDPGDAQRLRGVIEGVMRTGSDFRERYRAARHGAGERWLETVAWPIQPVEGRYTHLVGATRDVSEEVAAAQREAEWRARFEYAVDASGQLLFDLDMERNHLYWEGANGSVFGHDPAALDTMERWLAVVHPDDVAGLLATMRQSHQDSPTTLTIHYRLRAADGLYVMVEARGRIISAGGRPLRAVGLVGDISARHRAEEQLRLQARVLDSLAEGVSVYRDDGTIVFVNRAMAAMFRLDESALVGMYDSALNAWPARLAGEREAEVRAEVVREGQWTGELLGRRADGSVFKVMAVVTLLDTSEGRLWVAVRSDITELRRLEGEVLEVSQREKEQVAHDLHDGLGQELTGIALLARSLQHRAAKVDRALGADVAQLGEYVNHAVVTCRSLAQGVAAFVLRHGGLEAALRDLAQSVAQLQDVEVELHASREVADSLPESRAYHLFRIAQEALNNAVRHGRARHVVLVLEEDAPGSCVLMVRDNGRGFAREDAAMAAATGMGLRIMRYRAGIVNGVLEVGRAAGGGTVVRCTFPAEDEIETGRKFA